MGRVPKNLGALKNNINTTMGIKQSKIYKETLNIVPRFISIKCRDTLFTGNKESLYLLCSICNKDKGCLSWAYE